MIRTNKLKGQDLVDRLRQLSNPINESVVSMIQPSKYHNRIVSPQPMGQFHQDETDEDDVVDLDKIIQDLEDEIMMDEILDEMLGNNSDEDSELEEWLNEMDDDYNERWGYYGDEDIDVSELDREELKDLIYQVLTDREEEKQLSEQHNIKFDGIELKGGFSGGNTNTLVYRPTSSKMSDKIEDMGIPREKIIKKIISFLQKKYRGLKFDEDYSYEGYGYPIRLDMWSFN
ncbi:MAG: hypothetical protein ACON4B_04990 [Flavobacteriaceae bacterium]